MNQHRVKQFSVAEAKAKFSELVDAATLPLSQKSGTPVAMLVPLVGYESAGHRSSSEPTKGRWSSLTIFDEPDQEIIDLFENSGPLFPGRKE
jgi:antitoxin (DNA-binding transcriptional repressor) of toxin-antitoxin stability system